MSCGRRAEAASGWLGSRRKTFRGASDAPRAGDIDSRRHRPKRRPWRAAAAIGARLQLRPSHGLRRPDARKRLTAGQVVAARRSAAHRTRREPKMRIEPQIVLRGGRDGRRRRSARSLCGPSDRQSCCRPSGLPQRTPPSLRRSTRGAFDAPRTGDADRAADRHMRRPWWSAAAVRARPLAPRPRRGRCGHGQTRRRGSWAGPRSQQSVPRRVRRSARRRCG